jgi:hypothetical protein
MSSDPFKWIKRRLIRGTAAGFRAIGCGVALSAASAVFVNAALGPNTKPVTAT